MLFLQAKYSARFQATLGHYDQERETVLDRVNSAELSEGGYLTLIDDLSARRQVDEERLLLTLTEGEWTNINGAANPAYIYQP